jgi:Protein of unknown function (DUF3341)
MSSVLAAFEDRQRLQSVLHRLRSAELGALETYTPQPLAEGVSPLPLAIFLAGVLITVASFALQVYANVWAYPLDIGGRPPFSWPAFVPIALENGILAAVAAGFFGYLGLNRLPRLYEPIDEGIAIRRASCDFWCVAVRTDGIEEARHILQACGAHSVEVLPE